MPPPTAAAASVSQQLTPVPFPASLLSAERWRNAPAAPARRLPAPPTTYAALLAEADLTSPPWTEAQLLACVRRLRRLLRRAKRMTPLARRAALFRCLLQHEPARIAMIILRLTADSI